MSVPVCDRFTVSFLGFGPLSGSGRRPSCVPGPGESERWEVRRMQLGSVRWCSPIFETWRVLLLDLLQAQRVVALVNRDAHRAAVLDNRLTCPRVGRSHLRHLICQPSLVVALGGPSRTRGAYSSSWMRPSNVRLLIMSKATSG